MRSPELIFFGDSLTQHGWSYEGGWLAIIADFFVRRVDVMNRGFSGYNSRMCVTLLPQLYPHSSSLANCRMFTIFLGANDASTGEQHVPVDEFRANLQNMIGYLQKMGLQNDRILLISLPPIDESKWGAREIAEGKQLIRELKFCAAYAEACKQIADQCQTRMINLYSSMIAQQNWRDFFSDGLHFSRKGSEFLANIFISMFSEILVDCPLRYPDWKNVDKANASFSLTQ